MAITKEDAERLKAYITAHLMGVVYVDTVTTGGCDTCGWGGTDHYTIDSKEDLIHGFRSVVDDFLASADNI